MSSWKTRLPHSCHALKANHCAIWVSHTFAPRKRENSLPKLAAFSQHSMRVGPRELLKIKTSLGPMGGHCVIGFKLIIDGATSKMRFNRFDNSNPFSVSRLGHDRSPSSFRSSYHFRSRYDSHSEARLNEIIDILIHDTILCSSNSYEVAFGKVQRKLESSSAGIIHLYI